MERTSGAAVVRGGAPAPAADDARAWREVRGRLLRFVRRRVDDDATAEDLVHDVIARAWRSRDTLAEPSQFQAWLFRITRNAVVDHYRARRLTVPLPLDLAEDVDDPGTTVRRALAACLHPYIDTLPEDYRRALVLSELDGLTQRETAARLGLSLSGAKSRVQRARRMLAARLLACCRFEVDARGAVADYTPRRPDASCCRVREAAS